MTGRSLLHELRVMGRLLIYLGREGWCFFKIWLSYRRSLSHLIFARVLVLPLAACCFTSKCTVHPQVAVCLLVYATPLMRSQIPPC